MSWYCVTTCAVGQPPHLAGPFDSFETAAGGSGGLRSCFVFEWSRVYGILNLRGTLFENLPPLETMAGLMIRSRADAFEYRHRAGDVGASDDRRVASKRRAGYDSSVPSEDRSG